MDLSLLGILVVVLSIGKHAVDCLDCRLCNNAERLTDCTSTVQCDPREACYTDEIITETGRVIYRAGCRALDVCDNAGKKRHATLQLRQSPNELVACALCCDLDRNNVTGRECNTALCGLQSTISGTNNECFECDRVHDINSCTTVTTCQQDQVCGTQTFSYGGRQGGQHYYNMGCFNKRLCVFGTQKILEYKVTGELAPNAIGKRDESFVLTCQACCGDGYCNTLPCHALIEKLHRLKTTGHLDVNTLSYVP